MKIHKATVWGCAACILLAFVLGLSLGSRHGNEITITQTVREAPTQGAESYSLLVNINTASAEELTVLPGIGDVYAGNIVAYREAHGNFEAVTELLNVDGIGQSRLEAIWDYITVGGIP